MKTSPLSLLTDTNNENFLNPFAKYSKEGNFSESNEKCSANSQGTSEKIDLIFFGNGQQSRSTGLSESELRLTKKGGNQRNFHCPVNSQDGEFAENKPNGEIGEFSHHSEQGTFCHPKLSLRFGE